MTSGIERVFLDWLLSFLSGVRQPALGFGIVSLNWFSGNFASGASTEGGGGRAAGVAAALDKQERTDDPVATTDAPPSRDPMYNLLDRDFDVTYSLNRVLVFGRAGFGRA